ncbi:MAG: tetratricopeptide repeat protein [Nodosilinea sp. WJT8-NPBG4]|nr:tetratricopeptide repeat protein [Nodosilinea sp. WJT8-NPBG4]
MGIAHQRLVIALHLGAIHPSVHHRNLMHRRNPSKAAMLMVGSAHPTLSTKQRSMAKPELTEWDEDLTASVEEDYEALVRSLQWAKGFGLLFVQCTPAEGERLMARVQADIADKAIDVLRLEGAVDDLYETVAALPNIDKTNVLFVTGLEKSLVPYIKPGYGSEGDYYAKDMVPKLLGKLNLQREKFRETFRLCFVFLVPPYAMKYLIRRAADFFDWRSGVWEFVAPQEELQQESQRLLQDSEIEKYWGLTPQQRRERFWGIEDLLTERGCADEEQSRLRREQGRLLSADQDFISAIAYYDAALALILDDHKALYNKGNALFNLDRYEDAVASYDAALAIKPEKYNALTAKGVALVNLGRHQDAIVNYDAALEIKPDYYHALFNKGVALGILGRYEEAIANYDSALAIKPEDYRALNLKGISLFKLGRYEEAIICHNTALLIKSDDHDAFSFKGIVLDEIGRYEEAMTCYDAALAIKPDKQEVLNLKGTVLDELGCHEEAITSYDAALAINPDNHGVLHNKGVALESMGRYKEAIACYDAALAIKPNYHQSLNNKGNALRNLGCYEEALACYDATLAIKPNDHQALNNKGIALHHLGRNLQKEGHEEEALAKLSEEIACYDAALAIRPDYQLAIDNKQEALQKLADATH